MGLVEKYIVMRRNKVGMTQKKLSELLGYETAQFVSNCEREKCEFPLAIYKPISRALRINVKTIADLKIEDLKNYVNKTLNL